MRDNLSLLAPATNAKGHLPGPLGLRLDEDFMALNALHGSKSKLDKLVPFGRKAVSNQHIWLRLWPDKIWGSGTPPKGQFVSVDIGHGHTHLRLRGVEALHFLAIYSTADLNDATVRNARVLHTRIGHYDVVLWWDSTRDIHLILNRSLAQSFCDHLRALALRHDPPDPTTQPRSVLPTAPDRRG
jgi:hypothetical protein